MKKQLLFTLSCLGLAACGQDAPGEQEIREALSAIEHKKGCATSVLFKRFPLGGPSAESNQPIIRPFIEAGFIQQDGSQYVLSERGQAAYDPAASGFCYTPGYALDDIRVVREETDNERAPGLSGAWHVSFKITPEQVDDWVKQPGVLQAASHASLEEITQPRAVTVRVARKHGEEALVIADPNFNFAPGIHYNMAF